MTRLCEGDAASAPPRDLTEHPSIAISAAVVPEAWRRGGVGVCGRGLPHNLGEARGLFAGEHLLFHRLAQRPLPRLRRNPEGER